jgi:hypothetical protein
MNAVKSAEKRVDFAAFFVICVLTLQIAHVPVAFLSTDLHI